MSAVTSGTPAGWLWAQLGCLLVSGSFVGSLFVLPPASIRALPRDHPTHIWYRMVATISVSVVLYVGFYYFGLEARDGAGFFSSVGLAPASLAGAARAVLVTGGLMAVFFAGPIVVRIADAVVRSRYTVGADGSLQGRLEKPASPLAKVVEAWTMEFQQTDKTQLIRNLLYAPIVEELVFRGLLLPILTRYYGFALDSAGSHVFSTGSVIVRCPLWFGIAHVHHFWEKIRRGQSWTSAALGTAVQLTYTSIFGAIATALFIRTGCVLSPIVSHAICNFMGLPDLGFMSPPSPAGYSEVAFMHPYRYALLAVHVGGLVAFSVLVSRWTEDLAAQSLYIDIFSR